MTLQSCSGGVYGNYKIDDVVFPAPATSWEEQAIAGGLNGVPINSSYKLHRWNWSSLDASIAKQVFDKFAGQQDGTDTPATLETDPYGADNADAKYGTATYTDFTILEVSPRSRGLPFYENVQLTFEVYIG